MESLNLAGHLEKYRNETDGVLGNTAELLGPGSPKTGLLERCFHDTRQQIPISFKEQEEGGGGGEKEGQMVWCGPGNLTSNKGAQGQGLRAEGHL